ncbi:MAG: TetR/AcrR family transcriptional regulator [Bifidobacterium mongoliense]|jgi:AcrR family transcriptional regulator|uniref:TetR/AcrR family transcriptional regulator n=1 Tax=Bifidobacterium mongoliense TaxID=518643 RepID=UPI002F352191
MAKPHTTASESKPGATPNTPEAPNSPAPTTSRDPHQLTDRHQAILDAAVLAFGRRGYYGTSLQSIATTVGLTKPGVLHYIGSKEGLLTQVLTDVYDAATDRVLAETSTAPRPSLARFLRRVVAINAHRPELVQMFSTLSAEALDPEHPAHDYFAQRERSSVRAALQVPWAAPPSVDARDVLESGLCLMDGLQLRWLRDPGQDLNAMWRRCERTLMPSPLWDNYR